LPKPLNTANTGADPSATLTEALYTQGFGTRALCAGLVQRGQVRWLEEPTRFEVQPGVPGVTGPGPQAEEWPVVAKAYLMLHKPAGYECSAKPGLWPSVYSLLPAPLRNRPVKGGQNGVQAVGRLDQDTTGLLLLSDDGAFIHRLTSPKHHVPKVYQVTCEQPVNAAQVAALLGGVTLREEPKAWQQARQPAERPGVVVAALACEQTGDHSLALTLAEGKYHQVKRMVAAAGNRVAALHRSHMGALALPQNLPPGQWRWLSADDLALLN
jgi:16S rRNA pseudouridine516 synthase